MSIQIETRHTFPSVAELVPLRNWYKNPALRNWQAVLLIVLVVVPPTALVYVGTNAKHLTLASWMFAAYFAAAWLLLLVVLVRPRNITRNVGVAVGVFAFLTGTWPLNPAGWLESAGNSTSNVFASTFTVGLPEELTKMLPVLVVAGLALWKWDDPRWTCLRVLRPRDYLFLGTISGLIFGAGEAVGYFGHMNSGTDSGSITQYIILVNVWRILADPVSHALLAGIAGYFIGLAMTRLGPNHHHLTQHDWIIGGGVAGIGLGIAAVLHGFNDWNAVNDSVWWVLVTLATAMLFFAYARAGLNTSSEED